MTTAINNMEERKVSLEFLTKEFKCGKVECSRQDLESFPIPFFTDNVTDNDMQMLVNAVAHELEQYNFNEDNYEEEWNEAFWKELDECAAGLGIPYYEDIED